MRSSSRPTAALLLSVAVLLTSTMMVSAEYSKKDAVVILTEKNFEKEVLNSPDYWLVEFYAPWCGHCKNLEPEYKAAAKKLKQHARLGAVDATAHAQLAQKYKVQGYPTIKEFGANKKKPRDYQGGRTRKEIVQYVKNSDEAKKLGVSGVSVDTLEFKAVHTFLSQDETTPTALFIGSRRKNGAAAAKPPAWVSSLAQHFVKKDTKKTKKKTAPEPTVRIVFVPGSEDKIAKHLLLDDKLPALVFIDGANTKFSALTGSAIGNEASAKKFITAALATSKDQREAWTALPLFPAPEVAKKKPRVQLDGLTEAEITKCLSKKGKMCVIVTKMSSSGEEVDSTETIKELAKHYRRDPFRFLTADKNDPVFTKLVSFLEVTDTTTALVLKPGKAIKFTEHASPDEESLHQFLDRIIDGSTQFRVSKRSSTELFAAADDKAGDVHEEL